MDYKDKYIKYKTKYLELYNKIGGKKMKKRNKGYSNNKNTSTMENKKYSVSVSEPWFSLILLGLKTIEGRKNKGLFQQMQDGDIVEWTNDSIIPRSVKTKITGKAVYPTFREYLETEGLDKCLPGITNIDDGLSIYYKYFTQQEEKVFGVVAIRLELITNL
jgi:ASC-1-like (ASCH) protein